MNTLETLPLKPKPAHIPSPNLRTSPSIHTCTVDPKCVLPDLAARAASSQPTHGPNVKPHHEELDTINK
ncbi:hypothetical protein Pmani_031758 [Petrolisthes manimaculis]|uniref:Uncharacterized protein n=1 Tax=Petrolisthes manimaculis TaxID=1843537 RepID=A0AAE1TUH2_9EUCA|nr:hypothetical protein Pmani_031758 [Petrolisthes manimaculis]